MSSVLKVAILLILGGASLAQAAGLQYSDAHKIDILEQRLSVRSRAIREELRHVPLRLKWESFCARSLRVHTLYGEDADALLGASVPKVVLGYWARTQQAEEIEFMTLVLRFLKNEMLSRSPSQQDRYHFGSIATEPHSFQELLTQVNSEFGLNDRKISISRLVELLRLWVRSINLALPSELSNHPRTQFLESLKENYWTPFSSE